MALSWGVSTLSRTPVHAQAPVVGQPGIVAAYGFEEGTGTTVTDATGNGHTGSIANTDWSPTGRFSKALSFNATNSRVNIPDDNGLDLTVGMTVEGWVNPSTLSGGGPVAVKESPGGLAYAGTLTNAARAATGRFGRALSFNGTSACISPA
jgi:hypothetical protein